MKVYLLGCAGLHRNVQNSLYFKGKGQEKLLSFPVGKMSEYFYIKAIEKNHWVQQ